jgi:hypothetical protein
MCSPPELALPLVRAWCGLHLLFSVHLLEVEVTLQVVPNIREDLWEILWAALAIVAIAPLLSLFWCS